MTGRRALVVGQGLVGQSAVRALEAQGWTVETVGARALLAGEAALPSGAFDACVFAQGRPVVAGDFANGFDALLASRIDPLQAVAGAVGAETRVVLMSSTVGCLRPGRSGRDLPALQHLYEAAYLSHFPQGAILRLGAMRGPHWQIDLGLPRLRGTLLFKRLRLIGGSDIPWADDALLAGGLAAALAAAGPLRAVVADERGFDVNAMLDGLGPLALRIPLPGALFRAAWERLGAPEAFFRVTTADVRACGWPTIADRR